MLRGPFLPRSHLPYLQTDVQDPEYDSAVKIDGLEHFFQTRLSRSAKDAIGMPAQLISVVPNLPNYA
jgi:hypothetical protein